VKPFNFCPLHGIELGEPDEELGSYCEKCDRKWYRNSAPTVGCVIVRDGRALVSIRGSEPEKGRVDVPGGFLGPGEDAIEGLKREIKEELGLQVEVSAEDCIGINAHRYGDDGDYVLAIGFLARSFDGEPSANDDVADIRWVALDELDGLDFAWEHDKELVRKGLDDG
jgi:ADP-ribose pyrophosphatase YjhB (NUDIX family)